MRRALCFALLALLGTTFMPATRAEAQEMRFRWVSYGTPAQCGDRCPRLVEAQGTIGPNTPARFAEFIASSGSVPQARRAILLHSNGGVLTAGMELGLMIRQLGMTAFVGRFGDPVALAEAGLIDPGDAARISRRGRGEHAISGSCVSACVYAFLGGARRFVPDRSRLGVHRPFRAPQNDDVSPSRDRTALMHWDRGSVQNLRRTYFQTMGIDTGLIALEDSVASTSIRYLNAGEMRRLRLVTPMR